MIPFGAGAIFKRRISNPFPDHTYKFANVILASAIPADEPLFPIPVTPIVPGLHATGEVLKLPLRKYGVDQCGLFDYSYSTAKASPTVPHVMTATGSPTVDETGATFDASPEYYSTPGTADSLLGSGDYYVRADVRFDNVSLVQTILDSMTGANDHAWHLRFHGGIKRLDWATAIGTHDHYASWNPELDTWYKIEVIKASSAISIYVDDSLIYGPTADTSQWGELNKAIYIGRETGRNNDSQLYGSVRNVLMLKGTATATTSINWFPHDLFAYNPHEVLNLPLTGHTTDLSYGTAKVAPQTAHAVTLVGNANVTSGYLSLDGNGDFAQLPDSADWAFGTGNHTIEFWVKFNSFQTIYNRLIGPSDLISQYWHLWYRHDTKKLVMSSSTFSDKEISWEPSAGQWYHISQVRNGNTFTWRINGNLLGSFVTSAAIPDVSGLLYLGADTAAGHSLIGDMQDIRILKGVALYTDTFTPPARGSLPYALQDLRIAQNNTEIPYSAPLRGLNPITGRCDLWVRPALLSSTTDNEFSFYIGNAAADAPSAGVTWPTEWKNVSHRSGFKHDIVSNSDLTVSATPPSFTADGLVMDGTAKYCEIPYATRAADYTFATGDYTILMLQNPDTLSPTEQTFFNGGDLYNTGFYAESRSAGTFFFYHENTSPAFFATYTGVIVAGQTSLLSFRRASGTFKMGVNQSQLGTDYANTTDVQPDAGLKIGYDRALNGTPFDGTIYCFIVIKGTAITDDQLTVLDHLLREPTTYNVVGELELNVA